MKGRCHILGENFNEQQWHFQQFSCCVLYRSFKIWWILSYLYLLVPQYYCKPVNRLTASCRASCIPSKPDIVFCCRAPSSWSMSTSRTKFRGHSSRIPELSSPSGTTTEARNKYRRHNSIKITTTMKDTGLWAVWARKRKCRWSIQSRHHHRTPEVHPATLLALKICW